MYEVITFSCVRFLQEDPESFVSTAHADATRRDKDVTVLFVGATISLHSCRSWKYMENENVNAFLSE